MQEDTCLFPAFLITASHVTSCSGHLSAKGAVSFLVGEGKGRIQSSLAAMSYRLNSREVHSDLQR